MNTTAISTNVTFWPTTASATSFSNGSIIHRPSGSKPDTAGTSSQILNFVGTNKKTLVNSAIVFCTLTALVMLFFVIKAIRLKRAVNRSKRYGLVDADKLEMQRLEMNDDEDEDVTVFEINGRNGRAKASH